MKLMRSALGLCLVLFVTAVNVHAVDYYVDITNVGNEQDPYTNWATAATDIQSAVDAASDLDTVWIAPGTYTATNAVIPPGGTNVVEAYKPLTLRARDGATNTFINGEGTNRGIYTTYNIGGAALIVRGLTLTNCWAATGGAIWYDCYRPAGPDNKLLMDGELYDCVFVDNVATSSVGGAIRAINNGVGAGGFTMIMSNCVVRNNRSLTGDGDGGGMYCSIFSEFYLYDSLFENNTATNGSGQLGGGLYLRTQYRDAVIERTTFRGNRCSNEGGAIRPHACYMTMRNCLLVDNHSTRGGAMYTDYRDQWTFESCTVVSNTCWYSFSAGGLDMQSDQNKGYPAFWMYNTIVYDNVSRQDGNPQNNFIVESNITNLVYTNNCTIPTNGIPDFYTSGNITNDPAFVDLAGLDLHLRFPSPCLNTGLTQDWMDEAIDLDGNRRIDQTYNAVDMGCYELIYQGTAITIQ